MRILIGTVLLGFSAVVTATEPKAAIVQSPVQSEKYQLVLYYAPSCPHSKSVLNYLDSINKKITMKNVYADPKYKEELRAQGGRMFVPCLVINGKPMYESHEIINWLAEHKDQY